MLFRLTIEIQENIKFYLLLYCISQLSVFLNSLYIKARSNLAWLLENPGIIGGWKLGPNPINFHDNTLPAPFWWLNLITRKKELLSNMSAYCLLGFTRPDYKVLSAIAGTNVMSCKD